MSLALASCKTKGHYSHTVCTTNKFVVFFSRILRWICDKLLPQKKMTNRTKNVHQKASRTAELHQRYPETTSFPLTQASVLLLEPEKRLNSLRVKYPLSTENHCGLVVIPLECTFRTSTNPFPNATPLLKS